MHPSALYEGFLQSAYDQGNLPPLWNVIYQEAMRGHHLLFSPADVERYEAGLSETAAIGDDLDHLESTVVSLVTCADLQSMIDVIDFLPETQRRTLFRVYKRLLPLWAQFIRARMN